MSFPYGCDMYKGYTPENNEDNNDWVFVSKAKSLENAIKKAKSLKNGRWIRVFKFDDYGGRDYSYANEFQYFFDGERYYEYDVPNSVAGVKAAYKNRYEKFVKQNSTSIPTFNFHYLTVNNMNLTGADDYFNFNDEKRTRLYVGNFAQDIEDVAGKTYHRYFYSMDTTGYCEYYIREIHYLNKTTLSQIYRTYLQSFQQAIYNRFQINLPEPSQGNNVDLMFNTVFGSKRLFTMKDRLFDVVSYFFKLAEVNKENPKVDYKPLLELANDFRSCLPDFYENLNDLEAKAQIEIEKYKGHIEDEPTE
jgi:hypothetical protein